MTPRKRTCCTDDACSIGKVCAYTLFRTMCSTSDWMNTKDHVTEYRLLLESIHEFKSLQSSDSEQHNEEFREARRGQAGQGGQDGDTHQERKLASTIAHQSLLSSNQNFNSFSLCREPNTLFLDFEQQPITKCLNADLLLFSNASFC